MAEGLLRHFGGDRFDVASAGTQPGRVRREAIAVLLEIGVAISDHYTKSVDEFDGQWFDTVITVCDNAREACPVFPEGTQRLHWPFEDPASVEGTEEERHAAFRKIRDQIRERIGLFINSPAQ